MKIELKIDGKKMKIDKSRSTIEVTNNCNKLDRKAIIYFKEKRKLPKTWEEYCKLTDCNFYSMSEHHSSGASYTLFIEPQPVFEIDEQSRPAKQNKYTALRKLELLRDYYNEDIKVILGSFGIVKKEYSDMVIDYKDDPHFLIFRNSKLARKFLKNFKNLIEQAEDLI